MGKIHHVNLSVPVGGVDDEAEFLISILGYERLPSPDDIPMAKWFQFTDGSQIHLSEDPDHHPSARAHVAMELGDDLEAVDQRLGAAGYEVARSERPDVRVLFLADPAGNRWELRQPVG